MKSTSLFPKRLWMIAPACACGFLVFVAVHRIRHLDYLESATGAPVAYDPKSETGYAGGVRQFIPAVRDAGIFEPIAQTQQMLATGNWRVRHVDYDNAPQGRDVLSASPYRWWLGVVALVDSTFSGRPAGVSVERAALFADPLLQLILVIGTSVYVARRFGGLAGALMSLGLAILVPFAGEFIPGQPHGDGLAAIAALWSLLPLLNLCSGNRSEIEIRRDFFIAGAIGGVALWLQPGGEIPILAGVAMAAPIASWLGRREEGANGSSSALPWRLWALGGAASCLAAFAVEFLPGHAPEFRLDVINPLHGLAWLGIGELISRADGWLGRTKPFKLRRDGVPVLLAAIVVVVPIVLAYRDRAEIFGPDPSLLRLTSLSGGAVAPDIVAWLEREGFSALVLATLLPLLIVVPLAWLAVSRSADNSRRTAALLALGATVAAVTIGGLFLRRWIWVDATLLAALVVGVTTMPAGAFRNLRVWIWSVAVALVLLPGAIALMPTGAISSVSEPELSSLIERDLGHWLENRTGPGKATIIASPDLAASLAFEGGLHALGSPYRENRAGFELSLRIAGTSSQDEAYALVQNRHITHVVLASWDPSLEEFAKLGDKDNKSLVAMLHHWLPPRWLRPIPYPVPEVPGAQTPTVLVFEVVELQDMSVALSRLAEYFVETGRIGLANSAAVALGRMFPDDLGAQVARAQAASAAGNRGEANDAFGKIESDLGGADTRALPWDRRVSLAILLGEAKQFAPARAQLEKCLAEITEARLRALTPATLYRFMALMHALDMKPSDPRMAGLARDLLPPEQRSSF